MSEPFLAERALVPMGMSALEDQELDLFVRALESPPADRKQFLDSECRGDDSLRERMESLLALFEKEDDIDGLLEPPVLPPDLFEGQADHDLDLNITTGDYEIQKLLGRGSMGNVYQARQLSLNRLVALKMIRGSVLSSESDVARFRQEAQATANLHHPNIVPIYDVGEMEDHAFFSMKLLSGGCLTDWMEELARDRGRAMRVFVKVARAVHAAHLNGIIHRDLKPSNILLDEAGEPYVADFGLAKYSDDVMGLTMTGQIIGTPSYMAPEQAEKGAQVSTLADVYGLGAILYQMLAGHPPFRGESVLAVLEQLRRGDVVPPSQTVSSVDPDLETIALKCLQREPTERYESALQLAQDIERWQKGEPIQARPLTRWQHWQRWIWRNPMLSFLGLVSLLLLTVLAIGGPLVAVQQKHLLTTAEESQRKEHEANEDRRRNLYAAEMILASQLADQADGLPQITELLSHWEPARDQEQEPDLRGWEWYYLKGLTERQVMITDGALHQAAFPQWLPESDQIFVAYSHAKAAQLWDCKKGEVIRQFDRYYTMGLSRTSEGHMRLLTSSMDDHQINTSSGEEKALPHYRIEDYENCFGLEWDPHHRFLAILFSYQEPKLKVWDAVNETWTPTLSDNALLVRWSPDGSQLAFVTAGGEVQLWNTGSQAISKVTSYQGIHTLAWHPTEPLLAIGFGKYIAVCSIPDGTLKWMLRSEKDRVTSLSWHPDGNWLAAGRSDYSAWIWEPAKERVLAKMTGHRGEVMHLSWKSDGSHLASGDTNGTVCVWDLKQELNRFRYIENTAAEFASWSPDGKRLAVGCISKRHLASIWDLQSGEVTDLSSRVGWGVALEWNHATDLILLGDAMNRPTYVWDPNYSPPKQLKEFRYKSQSQDHYSMVAWSPDGKLLALPGLGEIEIVEHPNGSRKVLKGHTVHIQDVCWNPDSTLLASAGLDETVRVWAVDGTAVEVIECGAPLQTVTWNPAGSLLAIADHTNQIRIWNLAKQCWVANLTGHARPVYALSWSRDGKRLASGSQDHSIRIWDMEAFELVAVMNQHTKRVLDVEWSPDGKSLVSAGEDKIIVWPTGS